MKYIKALLATLVAAATLIAGASVAAAWDAEECADWYEEYNEIHEDCTWWTPPTTETPTTLPDGDTTTTTVDDTTTTTVEGTTTTESDETTTTEGPATTTTVEIETPTTVLGEDGPEPATTDVVCDDFTSVADANAHFAEYPADFDRLDGDNDGFACEEKFGDGTQPVAAAGELPRTGVDSITGLLIGAGAFIGVGTYLGMMARRREYLARQ